MLSVRPCGLLRSACASLVATALSAGICCQDPPHSPTDPLQDPATRRALPVYGPPMPVDLRRPDAIDPADRAAAALRRLLRGETTPPVRREDLPADVAIPLGPPVPAQLGEPADPDLEPGTPEPPEPEPPQDPTRIDPIDAARRALERRHPELEPVERPVEDVRIDPGRASDPANREPLAITPAPAPAVEFPVDGFVTLQYRGRHADDGDHDLDLLAVSGIDVGEEGRNDFAVHLLGRARLDLDGRREHSVFDGLQDASDGSLETQLWEGWLDFYRLPGLRRLRVGRLVLDDTPEILLLDGARVDSLEFGDARIVAGGYVGAATRHWSSSNGGDWIGGFYAEARPWDRGRVRADWSHVEDDRQDIRYRDDLVGLSVWQGIDDAVLLHARHTLLDGRGRDLLLRADLMFADLGLRSTVAYTELLTAQARQTLEFDPYFDQLFELFPFRQLTANATQTFFETLDVTVGADVRRLDDDGEEGRFNRDFERWYASLSWIGLADGDVVVSTTIESWQTGGDEVTVWTGDVAADLSERWRASLGTDYSAYRYDRFTQQEREDVTTVFGRLGYRDGPWRASFGYELERSSDLTYHVLEASVTWSF